MSIEKYEKEEFLPLMCKTLTPFLKKKAADELHEDEAFLETEIKELRALAIKNEVPCCLDDDFLIWFIRSRKHNMKRSLEQLMKYSYERHNWMKYYGFIFFDEIRVPIERGICGILPKRDSEGRVIMFLRANQWDPNECDCDSVLKAIQALSHFALTFPATQISGFCFIIDSALASLDTLRLFIKYARIVAPTIHIFPGRFQRITLVNVNIVLRGLSQILLAILPAKLRKRTQFVGDIKEALPKIFHPSILPEEFGGTLGPLNTLTKEWFKDFEDFVPKLRASNMYYKRSNTIPFPEN